MLPSDKARSKYTGQREVKGLTQKPVKLIQLVKGVKVLKFSDYKPVTRAGFFSAVLCRLIFVPEAAHFCFH